ncbi:MAG: YcaO-like family protein [Polyangia bacterium]
MRKLLGLTGFSAQLSKALYAGGKGHSIFNMFISSVSEAVERIFGMMEYLAKVPDLVFGTYRQLTEQGYPCLGPRELHLFAEEQYHDSNLMFDRFTEETPLAWMEGRYLLSGRKVLMPAQLIAIFYAPIRRDEGKIGYSTSGGLASHINEREAIAHGITELFERDGVNIHWYSKIPPALVEIDRPLRLPALRRLLTIAQGLPSQPRFYLHALDVPEMVVMTVIELDRWLTRYAYYAGGGVDMDAERCMLSSLDEFGQAELPMRLALNAPQWGFARGIDYMFGVDPDDDASMITNFIKVVAFYGYKKNYPKLKWYVEPERRMKLSALPECDLRSTDERWDALMQILERHRIDPIVFDFTPPQMGHIRLMKTYIPELAPPFTPSIPLLGHPRYYELPQKLGFAHHRLTYSELNKDPMPYP